MYGLHPIMRVCLSENLFAFSSSSLSKKLRVAAPFFNAALNYNMGTLLAPVELFPSYACDDPYCFVSSRNSYFKVCKIPNMIDYWKSIGGAVPSGSRYVLLGLSNECLAGGKNSIAAYCCTPVAHYNPPFCVGFL